MTAAPGGGFYRLGCGAPLDRRDFLRLGGAAVTASLLGSPGTASAAMKPDGRRIVDRYVLPSARPWAIVHGIRALNRDYPHGEKTAAVYVLGGFLEERVVNGQAALAFPIGVEAHTNVFLKSFLEAGLPLDLSFTRNGRRASLRDVLEGARRLFRFQPATQDWNDLAWSLIAFSVTTPAARDGWNNAWGETVRLRDVVEAAFRVAEEASAPVKAAMQRASRLAERAPIHHMTCGGTHLVYSLIRAVRAGYTEQQHAERLRAQLDMLVWRLVADVELIEAFHRGRPELALHRKSAILKYTGHAFECLNAAATWGLWAPRPGQRLALEFGRDQLAPVLAEVSQIDIAGLLPAQQDLYDVLTGDTCHAVHGLGFARQVV